MGETTGISWTDHTFNPWWGCTKVTRGCDHCYAETFDRRLGGAHWGKGKPRRVFGTKHWSEALRWNAAAEKAGKRARVFCASMADVFDAEAPKGQLERLWNLIRVTPWLDWQLLTKRPARIARALPADWGEGWPNVWLGTTVEDQEQAKIRIPLLLGVPARVWFLSCEPLLAALRLDRIELVSPKPPYGPGVWLNAFTGVLDGPDDVLPGRIGWIIMGGESGPGARPFALDWARALVNQAHGGDARVFVKQLGARPVVLTGTTGRFRTHDGKRQIELTAEGVSLRDRKGGDWDEWPEDLRVREFPEVRR